MRKLDVVECGFLSIIEAGIQSTCYGKLFDPDEDRYAVNPPPFVLIMGMKAF